MRTRLFALAAGIVVVLAYPWQVQGAEAAFVPLFNGKDLSGWVHVNGAAGTFRVQNGVIVTTGMPHSVLRSEKQYENFVVEMEWRHMKPTGNSGLFVWSDALPAVGSSFPRAIEVQILDGRNSESYTSHGDIFSIRGATCKPDRPHPKGWDRCLPSELRCKPAGEWNHYRVTCNNGTVKLAVNGKEVSGVHDCTPRKGYLCLEAEGSECHFRNLKIQELPGTGAKPEQTADLAQGFQPLYSGLDLAGWHNDSGRLDHWLPQNGILSFDGKAKDQTLWTDKEYGNFVLMCDWRFTAKPSKMKRPVILPSGNVAEENGTRKEVEVLDAGDSGLCLRGSDKSQVKMWCWPIGSGDVYGYRTNRKIPADLRAAVTPRVAADKPPGQWNRFVITMKDDRLTVHLNGKTVIDHAQLPGVAKRGKIALHHHSGPIDFTNLFIKELE